MNASTSKLEKNFKNSWKLMKMKIQLFKIFQIQQRCSNHNISKETRVLNDTLDQMDFTDIYRTLHPNTTEYTFFSSAQGTFSGIDHILGHKSGLSQYQKIGIVPCIFSNHDALKLDLNHKKKSGRNSNTWRF